MKFETLATLLFAAAFGTAASAQTPTVVNGQKVLVGKDGTITLPRHHSTQPPSAPLVGGADSCITPDVVVGAGPFAFDVTLATTGAEGQNESLCNLSGTTAIADDVWFTWTAPSSGSFLVSTCGQATLDAKLAVYDGTTCPVNGSALACDDDFCAFAGPSRITFNATAGNNYVIQLGIYPFGTPGNGTFTVAPPSPPPTNDSCTTPMAIVGLGSLLYDTTLATTGAEGQSESLCNQFGTIGISNDLWYTWVAPFSGTARVANCGGTNGDTKFAAYAGAGCPASGTAIACNDQGCGGGSSQIDFAVTQGSSYTWEIGDHLIGNPGPGTFTISQLPPPPSNDDCQTPAVLAGPGTYAFDSSNATDSPQQGGSCPNVHKDLWYTYAATTSGSATISTCGLITSTNDDTVIAVYAGAGCPASGSIACNDDTCGVRSTVNWPTVCGQTYAIQVGAYDSADNVTGSFAITDSGTACGPVGVPVCFGDGSGTSCPCGNSGAAGNGCASSVNASGANLTTSGNSLLANDTLVLHGTGMPSSSCLYFQGTTQVSAVFGDGLRCAGGAIVRLGTKTNVGGSSQYPTAGNPSVSVRGNVTTPGTRTYQVWYRNAAAFCTPSTFNLTNGFLITWQ